MVGKALARMMVVNSAVLGVWVSCCLFEKSKHLVELLPPHAHGVGDICYVRS